MAIPTEQQAAPAVKTRTRIAGIYTITNILDGKVYVGSSQHVLRRLSVHRWKLNRDKHDNIHLQRAWNRDGEAAFRFEIVERCTDDDLLLREQVWIDKMGCHYDRNGYNLCPVAGTVAGVVMPESHRQACRNRFKGKPKSLEQRAKMSAAAKGRPRSEETRAKIAAAVSTRFADPEERRLAAERQKGKPHALKGKNHSPESIANMKAAHQARWAGVPRKPRKKYPSRYVPIPLEDRKPVGWKKGEGRHAARKLTEDQIRDIRSAVERGETHNAIGRRIGLNSASIGKIIAGKTYRDVL